MKVTARRRNTVGRLVDAWGPAAVWAAVLFLLSAVPLRDDGSFIPVNDKVVHLVLYAVLGGTLARGRWRWRSSWPPVVFVAFGVLYGATDEWHQAFVPGRSVSVLDWTADTVGVVLGYTVVHTLISRGILGGSAPEDAEPGSEG